MWMQTLALTSWYWRIIFIRWIVLRVRLQALVSNVFGYFGAAHRIVHRIRWYIFQRFFTIWQRKNEKNEIKYIFIHMKCDLRSRYASIPLNPLFHKFNLFTHQFDQSTAIYSIYRNGHSTRRWHLRRILDPSPLKLDKNQQPRKVRWANAWMEIIFIYWRAREWLRIWRTLDVQTPFYLFHHRME